MSNESNELNKPEDHAEDNSMFVISPEEQAVLDYMQAELDKGNDKFLQKTLFTKSIRVAGYVTISACVVGGTYLLAKTLLED